ncbi:MAG: J domain-containing protein [Alphaproteobacteria bacterium]|nr:J domain-containing protein [Alphaproteobacteria bacterium]
MRDPYEVLGVPKTASAAEIKAAFRKQAKQCHPDTHPGDKKKAERFREISTAHEVLSDRAKRAQFDRGEINADGSPRAPQRAYSHAGQRAGGAPFGFEADVNDDFLSEFFSGLRGGRRQTVRARGEDVRYRLNTSFIDAAKGGKERITLSNGKTLDVNIPAGVQEGKQIRLRGQGEPGVGGGPPGDVLIEIAILPHPMFVREGNDIHLILPISLQEAVLGAKIAVPTIDGPVTMNVAKGANSGTKLRLAGKGCVKPGAKGSTVARGDQIVTLQVRLPEKPDDALSAFVKDWVPKHPYDPRAKLKIN